MKNIYTIKLLFNAINIYFIDLHLIKKKIWIADKFAWIH